MYTKHLKFATLNIMKKILLSICTFVSFILLLPYTALAQWTWVDGSVNVSQNGNYGTMNVTAPSNMPGGRYETAIWIDASNNVWIYGGWGYAAAGGNAMLSDLWKFDGTNWTWINGSTSTGVTANYGTKGVPLASNTPGGRDTHAFCIDASGNLWLFGGQITGSGNTALNDLWKWDGTNWTWVSGSTGSTPNGNYGTKNVTVSTNMPGGRENGEMWTDASGNIWLFGGRGFGASGGMGNLNDLWKYDGTNWTWISGDNFSNTPGSYGTKGVASPTNAPPGRYTAAFWKDVAGNFWIFGGTDMNTGGVYNDLWKFDGTNWTWVSGNSGENNNGTYGTQCIPSVNNSPGGRHTGAGFTVADGNQNLWLFGGYGLAASGAGQNTLNDLWKYNIPNNTWTWVLGSNTVNQSGVYGTMGVPAPTNIPGGIYGHKGTTDGSGNLWFFGGNAYNPSGTQGLANDLWRYSPTAVTLSLSSTTPMTSYNTTICSGNSTTLSVGGGSGNYLWTPSATLNSPTGATVVANPSATSSYTVSDYGCGAATFTVSVGNPSVKVSASQTICIGTPQVLSATGALAYTWSPSTALSANTGSTVTATPTVAIGYTYSVSGTDGNGCSSTASVYLDVVSSAIANAGGNISTCSGVTATLNGGGGSTYTWMPNSGLNSNTLSAPTFTITVLGNYTYTLTVDIGSSCASSAQVVVTVNGLPSVSVGPNQTVCVGTPASLTASGASNYIWTPSIYLSSATGSTITSTPTVSGIRTTYTVTGADLNGCKSNNEIMVTTVALPTVNAGPDRSICSGSLASLSATGNGGNYLWMPSSGLAAVTSGSTTFSQTSPGTYSYTVTLSSWYCNASASDGIVITALSLPTVITAGSSTICNGSSTSISASGANTYLWNNGVAGNSITVSPTTNTSYTVTGTDINGCSNAASVEVVSSPVVVSSADVSINMGQSATIAVTGNGTKFLWSPKQTLSCDTCSSTKAFPASTTLYYVTVSDNNGCSRLDSVLVTVVENCGQNIFIPNAFSPNGDGKNDRLLIGYTGTINCFITFSFEIYDRWGNQVFDSTDLAFGWDGTYKGRQMDNAVFVYSLQGVLTDGSSVSKKGNISLIK